MVQYSSAVQAKIEAIREKYINNLPQQLRQIEQLWQAVRSCDDGGDSLVELHRALHTLAGSGSTFDFEVLGKKCRFLEVICKRWLAGEDIPVAAEREDIDRRIHALFSEFEVARKSVRVFGKECIWQPSSGQRGLIYLLDDDQDFLDKLSVQLVAFGYQVRSFLTLESFEVAYRFQRPAAALVDIIIPPDYLAGVDFVAHLREEGLDICPIVFMSVRDDFEARIRAVRAGGDAFFVKPVSIECLVERLDELTLRSEREDYKVLIIDDDRTLSAYYKAVLEEAGMVVTLVHDPEQTLVAMAQLEPDIILMDMYMPHCSGSELAKLLRQQGAYMSTPIVYLSVESDRQVQCQALARGGDDFLTKPINGELLVGFVQARLQRFRQLNTLISQDSLTGLLKHTKVKEQLAVALSRAERHHLPLAYALLDIDRFKLINDEFGHMAGDEALKGLARMLKQHLRKEDSLGRYGGDEFAVVMPDTDMDTAARVMNELRQRFERMPFAHDGREFFITLSVGISGFPQVAEATAVSAAADAALYKAKGDGRNRVVV